MSADATGWVFRESPYSGVMFVLHLAIADIVNDTYGNELWASVPNLAAKARVSERTVRSGLHRMVDDGLLVLVAAREGCAKRYQFVMPDPCTVCTPAPAAPLHREVEPLHATTKTPAARRATPAPAAPNPNRTQEIPTGSQLVRPTSTPRGFDEFWNAYPAKKGKGAAKVAWVRAVKRAPIDTIVAGAVAYCSDPRVLDGYIKNPATWLNQDCWEDEPIQARPKVSQSTANLAAWVERTS